MVPAGGTAEPGGTVVGGVVVDEVPEGGVVVDEDPEGGVVVEEVPEGGVVVDEDPVGGVAVEGPPGVETEGFPVGFLRYAERHPSRRPPAI
ncbi:hypothetical protein [Streptomyces yangpuensis]|uniref:hypothetical protein n=1 Tax=Streptomyces yangpuensis TaxID=1648182 RepID=UPI00382B946D